MAILKLAQPESRPRLARPKARIWTLIHLCGAVFGGETDVARPEPLRRSGLGRPALAPGAQAALDPVCLTFGLKCWERVLVQTRLVPTCLGGPLNPTRPGPASTQPPEGLSGPPWEPPGVRSEGRPEHRSKVGAPGSDFARTD